jgi:hypothetical protein
MLLRTKQLAGENGTNPALFGRRGPAAFRDTHQKAATAMAVELAVSVHFTYISGGRPSMVSCNFVMTFVGATASTAADFVHRSLSSQCCRTRKARRKAGFLLGPQAKASERGTTR